MDIEDGNTVKMREPKRPPGESPSRVRSSQLASLVISFLEGQGLQVYQMQSIQEAYQVKSNGEILRFYISRLAAGKKD